MRKMHKWIICMFVVILAVSGCSGRPSGGSGSVLEFFGFQSRAAEPTKVPAADPGKKAENAPAPDADPFNLNSEAPKIEPPATEVPKPEVPAAGDGSSSGSSLSDMDWDNIDPALIDWDEEIDTKSESGIQDDWKNDPDLWSFSSSTYEDVPVEMAEKQAGGFSAPVIPTATGEPSPLMPAEMDQGFPAPNNPVPHPNQPPFYFYRVQDNPVFRPMRELPRTGFSAGSASEIRQEYTYAETSMSLSIPTLNVTEDIVIVPLVDDNYPVESLGTRIGLLEGSGPGEEDLFVLVGHNHLNMQDQGPFVELSAMNISDLIFVNGANNSTRKFVVYANEKFASEDIEGLLSYAKPGCMILITCEDESIDGGYLNRRIVFAEAKED